MAFIKKIKRKWQGQEKWTVTTVTQGNPVSTKELCEYIADSTTASASDVMAVLLALPATTLTEGCYYSMFYGCSSLTSAPALPATTLPLWCYAFMFQGCTSLNSVTCLATNISADVCTANWLQGVASTGTFTKASGATWPTGSNGIPSNWTVNEQ